MDPKHTADFTVRLQHIGPHGQARPSLFFDCFQDAASEQSARLGISIHDLQKRGLTWVVSRYHVQILRYPRWRERLRVTTWRVPQQNHTAPREFIVTDADHRTLCLARGVFVLLDRVTDRPVSPREHLPTYPVADERVWKGDSPTIPAFSTADFSTRITVRHVKNTRYIDFALECVPRSIAHGVTLEFIDVNYSASARPGDTLLSLTQQMDGQGLSFIHHLVDDRCQLTYTGLITRWYAIR